MGTFPPDLLEILNVLPLIAKVTADPVLTAMVRFCATDTVAKPATGVDTVAPLKLIAVILVPTLFPDCFSSTPEITSVRLAPLPENDTAVTIPLELMFPDLILPATSSVVVGTVLAIPTLSFTLSTMSESPEVKLARLTALDIAIFYPLFSYLY